MREVLDRLTKATALLTEVEDDETFLQCSNIIIAKLFRAHAIIKWTQAKLCLLREIEEEMCEKS